MAAPETLATGHQQTAQGPALPRRERRPSTALLVQEPCGSGSQFLGKQIRGRKRVYSIVTSGYKTAGDFALHLLIRDTQKSPSTAPRPRPAL